MPVLRVRVTSHQLWWRHNAKSEKTANGKKKKRPWQWRNERSMIVFSGIVCSAGHKLAYKKSNNAFVTLNNDFFGHSWCDLPMISTRDFVTRENHWQLPHSWPKIIIHGNSCIILYIINSHNGLVPVRCQAIIWTNDDLLLIRPLKTNFIGISIRHMSNFRAMMKSKPMSRGFETSRDLTRRHLTI